MLKCVLDVASPTSRPDFEAPLPTLDEFVGDIHQEEAASLGLLVVDSCIWDESKIRWFRLMSIMA